MATNPQPSPRQSPRQPDYRLAGDATVVSAIAAALASGSLAAVVALLKPLIPRLKVSLPVFASAVWLALKAQRDLSPPTTQGPAYVASADPEAALEALYLMRAAQRMQATVDSGASVSNAMGTEARFYGMHILAQENRRRAASLVDLTVAQEGSDLLGWKAVMDSRTSAECADANGKNFRASDPPLIGYPGAVHPRCRCRPVGPFLGAPLVGQEWTLEQMLQKSPERV
jgi:hypothetical protein